jgi:hypothetical protein
MLLLCAFLISAAIMTAQTVEGTVVNTVTGVGIPDVQVQLGTTAIRPPSASEPISRPKIRGATTDAQGRFRFEDVADGSYGIGCVKEGFRTLPVGPFRVIGGGDPVKVRVEMVPYSRIAGRVVDDKGRPVADAKVVLAIPGRDFTTMSDENGAFAFEQLTAGSYTLSARPPSDLDPPPPVKEQEFTWAQTYYPGVTIAETAARIPLSSGTEAADIEVKLQKAPLRHIRGIVLNPRGEASPGATVTLADDAAASKSTTAGDDGSFDIVATDGSWHLRAEPKDGDADLEALATVPVDRRDANDIKLRLVAPFSIAGVVTFDPPLKDDAPKRLATKVTLEARGRVTTEVAISESGNFTIEKVFPGTYTVRVSSASVGVVVDPLGVHTRPQPYYLATLRVAGQDALSSKDVEIASEGQTIEIRFESHGGTIRGTVAEGASVQVVLMPQEPWLAQLGLVRFAMCDANGHFEISQVRPGNYYIGAVNRGNGNGITGPEALDSNTLLRASTITVRPEETASIDLHVIK